MILLKEENTAPLFWPLGRIERIYRGEDNNVRVAEIFTKGKICKRPIVKLALLPVLDNEMNENDSSMSKWYESEIASKDNNDLILKTESMGKKSQKNETKKSEIAVTTDKDLEVKITIDNETETTSTTDNNVQIVRWKKKPGIACGPFDVWTKLALHF